MVACATYYKYVLNTSEDTNQEPQRSVMSTQTVLSLSDAFVQRVLSFACIQLEERRVVSWILLLAF